MKDKGAVFSNFVETDKIHEALQRKSACFAQKSKPGRARPPESAAPPPGTRRAFCCRQAFFGSESAPFGVDFCTAVSRQLRLRQLPHA